MLVQSPLHHSPSPFPSVVKPSSFASLRGTLWILLSILLIDVQLPLIKSQSVLRFSGLAELGPPGRSFSRSLRLCEIPFPQSVRSLAKTLRSPREFPYRRSHRHPCPSVSSVINRPPHTLLVATLLLQVLLWLFPILPPGPIAGFKKQCYWVVQLPKPSLFENGSLAFWSLISRPQITAH